MKDEDSDLAKLFSGKVDVNETNSGEVFLNRNPEIFMLMIDYLENGFKIGPIPDDHKMAQFKLELEHWKIKN